ncbi:MAG: class F sortase, partial [Thermomicrobiales bacterium]
PATPPPAAVTPAAPVPRYVRRLGDAAALPPRAGQPVRLKIPSIGVDAPVEQVGKTPDGAMDVPKDFYETAWYQLGPRPGEAGNAVIDGHVDSTMGKAIFYDLRKLVHGDQITVVGDDGAERHFVVADMGTYATQDVPLARVFGPATGAHLNLITCDSNTTFNQTTHSYDGNLVVYADAMP